MAKEHKNSTLGERHAAHNWEYADATARAAATGMAPDDVGKLARQLDDNSLWLLSDDSPVTWDAVGGGGGAVDSVNGLTGVVVLDPDDLDDSATTNKFTTAAEITKLAGIETLADVTDATNVAAAGAVMESDTTTAAMGFVIDEDSFASNLATKIPTQQSVKEYVDAEIAAAVLGAGSYTDEQAQDAVGTILTDSSSIDFTYTDATPAITASVVLEWLQDAVAAMLTGGSHTGITATYQDAGGVVDLAATLTKAALTYTTAYYVGNGTDAIAAGVIDGDLYHDHAVKLIGWTLLTKAAPSGAAFVVDLWNDTYANFPPLVADTIIGAEKPTVAIAATKGQDLSLNGGAGIAFSAGTLTRLNVDTVGGVTFAALFLHWERT